MAGIFTRPRAEDITTESPGKSSAVTLGADVDFKGSLNFKDKLHINGRFEGDLSSEGGLLVVGKNAEIRAEIRVGNLISEGKIFGNTVVADKVELRAPAQVFGDIQASRFSVEEGVIFVGTANINPADVSPSEPEKSPVQKKYVQEDEDALDNQIKF